MTGVGTHASDFAPMHRINDYLFMGAVQAVGHLKANNIQVIVSLGLAEDHEKMLDTWGKKGVFDGREHHTLVVSKSPNVSAKALRAVLDQTLAFIKSAHDRKLNILVHCQHGCCRSAMAVVDWLLWQNRLWSVEQALAFLQSKRACAQPYARFLSVLEGRAQQHRTEGEQAALMHAYFKPTTGTLTKV